MSLQSSLRSLSWCVREPLKLLDGYITQHMQQEAVTRSVPVWEDRLSEFEAENDGLEACPGHRIDFDKRRNRWACIYCQKTATLAEYAEFGPHRYSDTEVSPEPPYLSWGVDGATTEPPHCPNQGQMCNCTGQCLSRTPTAQCLGCGGAFPNGHTCLRDSPVAQESTCPPASSAPGARGGGEPPIATSPLPTPKQVIADQLAEQGASFSNAGALLILAALAKAGYDVVANDAEPWTAWDAGPW